MFLTIGKLCYCWNWAPKTSQEAQGCYNEQYDKAAVASKFQIGDWVLVHFALYTFPETGKMRKLWHVVAIE